MLARNYERCFAIFTQDDYSCFMTTDGKLTFDGALLGILAGDKLGRVDGEVVGLFIGVTGDYRIMNWRE